MTPLIFIVENDDQATIKIAIESFVASRSNCLFVDATFDIQGLESSSTYDWIILNCSNFSVELCLGWNSIMNRDAINHHSKRYLLIGEMIQLNSFSFLKDTFKINLEVLSSWNSTIGLILCGGQSKRMNGHSKALLKYHHDKEQYLHIHDMIWPYLPKVYISIKKEMKASFDAGYNYVYDDILDIGPMSGLISAIEANSNVNILVIGCDYPMITEVDIVRLITAQDRHTMVTCYQNGVSIDPMLAIYSQNVAPILQDAIRLKRYSLKRLILEVDHIAITPTKVDTITSIDDAESYLDLIEKLNREDKDISQIDVNLL